MNNTWINTLDFKDSIENHSFDVGGLLYGVYEGEDKGIIKEKEEEKVLKWNGKIGLLSITEYAESSASQNCTSVYSNYYQALNTDGNNLRENLPTEGWPCKNSNFNSKNYVQWTISAISSTRPSVWDVHSSGFFIYHAAWNPNGVRPAFYLKSSVKLGGLGTSDEPYYIES